MITTILIGIGCFIGGYITCAMLCMSSQGDREKERWDAYQEGLAAGRGARPGSTLIRNVRRYDREVEG